MSKKLSRRNTRRTHARACSRPFSGGQAAKLTALALTACLMMAPGPVFAQGVNDFLDIFIDSALKNAPARRGAENTTPPERRVDQSGPDETTRALQRGIQRDLSALGYDPGPIDGILGRKTREAISEFQKSIGTTVTGRLNGDQIDLLSQRADAVRSQETSETASAPPAPSAPAAPAGSSAQANLTSHPIPPPEEAKEPVSPAFFIYGENGTVAQTQAIPQRLDVPDVVCHTGGQLPEEKMSDPDYLVPAPQLGANWSDYGYFLVDDRFGFDAGPDYHVFDIVITSVQGDHLALRAKDDPSISWLFSLLPQNRIAVSGWGIAWPMGYGCRIAPRGHLSIDVPNAVVVPLEVLGTGDAEAPMRERIAGLVQDGPADARQLASTLEIWMVDLDDDASDEALVSISAPEWCGSRGCPLLVVDDPQGQPRRIGEFTGWGIYPAVMRYPNAEPENGWHKLVIDVLPQPVTLVYDGTAYRPE